MTKLFTTLSEFKRIMDTNRLDFLITRFNNNDKSPDDIDILVRKDDFSKVFAVMKKNKWEIQSHDHALGGRLPGYQKNIIKKDRIKIDLHRDFTWRKQRYIDTNLLWKNSKLKTIYGVKVRVSDEILDVFLIIINLIFEKEYILNEYPYIKRYIADIEDDKRVISQSHRYNYSNTFRKFFRWFETSKKTGKPLFLPIGLVMYSYWEKLIREKSFDLVSFAYYFFFRSRYVINKRLPYN